MKGMRSERHSDLKNETELATGGHHLDTLLSSDGDGSSQLSSRVDDDFNVESVSGERDLYNDSKSAEVNSSARLQVFVHHYPMLMCPVSARVFVFPSEGAVAEACLSNSNETSLSPGLPSICTGLASDGEDIAPGITLTAHFLYNLAAKVLLYHCINTEFFGHSWQPFIQLMISSDHPLLFVFDFFFLKICRWI